MKMETLFTVAMQQRMRYCRDKRRAEHPAEVTISENDMKWVYNTWETDWRNWMRESGLRSCRAFVRAGRDGAARKFAHTAFNSFLFNLAGNNFLVHILIRFPLLAGHQLTPAHLSELLEEATIYKTTAEHRTVVEAAKKREEQHQRHSQLIWAAGAKLREGRALACAVGQRSRDSFELTSGERGLLQAYLHGTLHNQLTELKSVERYPLKYRGWKTVACEANTAKRMRTHREVHFGHSEEWLEDSGW